MKGKILIIDDEVDYAELLAWRLRRDGYEVLHCECGNKVLDTSRRTSPNLILMDIGLPDISGLEVYSRIRTDDKVKRIPIVFLSALHEKERHCLHVLKAEAFLKKPCDAALILGTIENVLATAKCH
jgi:DNA-binding response OmpR family regulator